MEDKEIKENINEDEKFYKTICEKYVATMSKEMLLEINNKIVYIFVEDKYIDLKDEGKINKENYKKYLEEDYSEFEYDSYNDLFNQVIKDNIRYDLNDLGVFDLDGQWEFYLTFEELRQIGFGDIVKDNYPLIQEYGVSKENIIDFFNHFTLEQLYEFEESLHLYFKTQEIKYDKELGFLTSETYSFNNDILKLACGLITYEDFIQDNVEQEKIIEQHTREYFRKNDIHKLEQYGEDSNEGLYHFTDLYKDLLDKWNINYTNIFTDEKEPGEYTTTIEFSNNNSISVDTKSHDDIKYLLHNLNFISNEYKKFMQKENEKTINEIDYEIN